MNKTLKKYLVSTAITFLSGFGLVILASIDNLSIESFENGAIIAIVFSASRAGVKASLEFLLAKYLK